MPDIDLADHRGASTAELLAALDRGDALALAEAFHRAGRAGHAVARRLLGDEDRAEALLREVFAELWAEPPTAVPLEAWVRYRAFVRGREALRSAGRPAAAPSLSLLLRETPREGVPDRVERLIADLDGEAVRALLLAHDRGTPTADQRDPHAAEALRRALLALADSDDVPDCPAEGIADYVLGLLDDEDAGPIVDALARHRHCADLAAALRRGRRRMEGLPPPADLGPRVVAAALASAPRGAQRSAAPAATASPHAAADDALAPIREDRAWFEAPDEAPATAPAGDEPPAAPTPSDTARAEEMAAPPAADAPPGRGEAGTGATGASETAPASALGEPRGGQGGGLRLSDLLSDAPAGPDDSPTSSERPAGPEAPPAAAGGPPSDATAPEGAEEPRPGSGDEAIGAEGGSQADDDLRAAWSAWQDDVPGRHDPSEPSTRPEATAPTGAEPVAAAAAPGEPAAEPEPVRIGGSFADAPAIVEEPGGRGRAGRVANAALMVLGGLLLLAAGAVVGLVILRAFELGPLG